MSELLYHEIPAGVATIDRLSAGSKTSPAKRSYLQGNSEIDFEYLLSDSDAAMTCYGESMHPTFPTGCVLGLKRCTDNFIDQGEAYVVETACRRMVKRLYYKDNDPSSGQLVCVSDNPEKFEEGPREGKLRYPHFYIPVNDIIGLYAINAVISPQEAKEINWNGSWVVTRVANAFIVQRHREAILQ